MPQKPIDRTDIRDHCTEAVFERGRDYYSDNRISERRRVDDTVTATVDGSNPYSVNLSFSEPEIDHSCTCPYDGPGPCKHVVAVLLSVADDPPPDEGERLDAIIEEVDESELRAFLRQELARDGAMLDRFVATFGDTNENSHEEYREMVDHLFEDHTQEYPVVVDAIDFGRLTDLGERYRERGHYSQAAAVYRGLVAGIDDNIELVDAAYDHYATTFREGLDAYVECVEAADLSPSEYEAHESFLAGRVETGSAIHREQFQRALLELQSANDE